MADERSRGGEPGTAGTLRGVVFIVVAGVALGVMYNTLGLASRPARGLTWIKRGEATESLESLQPAPAAPADSATRAPATVAAPRVVPATPPAASAEPRAAKPKSPADSTKAAKRAAGAKPEHPSPAKPGSATPAAPATPAAAPATPAAAASDLPVIPDLPHPIKLEMATLKKLYDAGAVLVVDAREADEYRDGHLAGALSLPYNDALAEPARMGKLGENGRPIVVYCSGGSCELSMDLAKALLENGRKRVLVYEGGFPEWQSAGYPVARGPQPGGR